MCSSIRRYLCSICKYLYCYLIYHSLQNNIFHYIYVEINRVKFKKSLSDILSFGRKNAIEFSSLKTHIMCLVLRSLNWDFYNFFCHLFVFFKSSFETVFYNSVLKHKNICFYFCIISIILCSNVKTKATNACTCI